MKSLMLLFAATLFINQASAQKVKKDDLPAAVSTAFATAYPSQKDVEWCKDGANYEAEFEVSDIDNAVIYDANGLLVATEVTQSKWNLSQCIRDYAEKNYPGHKIKHAEKITSGSVITYEILVDETEVTFNDSCGFISAVKETE